MEQFTALKRKALEKYFSRMNDQQRKAVFKIKGPLLILAGAGSGKTTVLVNRIANMIYFGNAYNTEQTYGTPSEQDIQFLKDYIDGKTNDASTLADIVAYDCIKPWSILAITFTNKAAGELKGIEEFKAVPNGHSIEVRVYRRRLSTPPAQGYSGVNVTSLDFQAVSPFMILTILRGL